MMKSSIHGSGIIKVGSLDVGSKVVDKTWLWDHATDNNPYSSNYNLINKDSKPVVWLLVAKDHYKVESNIKHLTLMSSESIANYSFERYIDDPYDYFPESGKGPFGGWAQSGLPLSNCGIRPFLNGSLTRQEDQNFYFMVAGVNQTDYRKMAVERLADGGEVILTREPDNPYDKNAIAVLDKSNSMLGYIPKHIAKYLSKLIDMGKLLDVSIVEVRTRKDRGPRARNAEMDLHIKVKCDDECWQVVLNWASEQPSYYGAFAEHFKNLVLKTHVPCVNITTGEEYTTEDYVFIPSHTELNAEAGPYYKFSGLNGYELLSEIGFDMPAGSVLPYFCVDDLDLLIRKRAIAVPPTNRYQSYTHTYYTRSIINKKRSIKSKAIQKVGAIYIGTLADGNSFVDSIDLFSYAGVRAMVNIRADASVFAETDTEGNYVLCSNG